MVVVAQDGAIPAGPGIARTCAVGEDGDFFHGDDQSRTRKDGGDGNVAAINQLRKVLADELGHFEHGDGFLSAKDRFEFVVRIDIAFVNFVLQVRGIGVAPTTAASVSLGFTGFLKAAFALRATFFAGFFTAFFFAAAIQKPPD
jgi:hypothetical protein